MRRVIGFLSTFMALIFTLCRVQGQIYTGCDHDEVLKSHPVFCNQFLQCSNGYLYEMKCDVDLVFNEKMQYCDWEHNVDRCSGLDTTTPSEATTPEEEATTTVEETTTQEKEASWIIMHTRLHYQLWNQLQEIYDFYWTVNRLKKCMSSVITP